MKKLTFGLLLFLGLPAFAAIPTVPVSSIAINGTTATVTTSSAHGLAVNQGFCLSAPENVCGVVATVANGTTFAYSMASQSACSSSCGTVQAAPQIIVLTTSTGQGGVTYNLLLWLTTQTPAAGPAKSAWTAANGSAGPTTAMLSALAAGYFVEVSYSRFEGNGISTSQIEADLQTLYSAYQATFASGAQPGQFYGYIYTPSGGWEQQ